jgi:hypothetical protein
MSVSEDNKAYPLAVFRKIVADAVKEADMISDDVAAMVTGFPVPGPHHAAAEAYFGRALGDRRGGRGDQGGYQSGRGRARCRDGALFRKRQAAARSLHDK